MHRAVDDVERMIAALNDVANFANVGVRDFFRGAGESAIIAGDASVGSCNSTGLRDNFAR